MAEQSGLLVVGILKDRLSRETTKLFIITTRKTRFYDLANALFIPADHILPKIMQSVSYKNAISERSTVTQ